MLKAFADRYGKAALFLPALIAVMIIASGIFYFDNIFKFMGFDISAGGLPNTPGSGKGLLAIVIDDFGQSRDGVFDMMSIDRHLTFAVMPFLQFSKTDAEMAHEKGYEVIVHLPMEPERGKASWLGPRPIMADMSGEDAAAITRDSFKSVPFASGANVHMGSKASSNEEIMDAVLDVVKEKKLYFLDSLTGRKPVSKKLSIQKGLICFERDIFLDGQKPKELVKKQLSLAAAIALKNGSAIAIGHVGIEGGRITAQAIKEMLPEFDKMNVTLVYLSELIQK